MNIIVCTFIQSILTCYFCFLSELVNGPAGEDMDRDGGNPGPVDQQRLQPLPGVLGWVKVQEQNPAAPREQATPLFFGECSRLYVFISDVPGR